MARGIAGVAISLLVASAHRLVFHRTHAILYLALGAGLLFRVFAARCRYEAHAGDQHQGPEKAMNCFHTVR